MLLLLDILYRRGVPLCNVRNTYSTSVIAYVLTRFHHLYINVCAMCELTVQLWWVPYTRNTRGVERNITLFHVGFLWSRHHSGRAGAFVPKHGSLTLKSFFHPNEIMMYYFEHCVIYSLNTKYTSKQYLTVIIIKNLHHQTKSVHTKTKSHQITTK